MPKKLIYTLLAFVFISVFTLVYFRKQLQHPAFNLIDDGYTLFINHQLKSDYSLKSWRQTLVERELSKGRLRPGYYLYYYAVSLFAQENPQGYWLAQVTCLAVILAFVFWFLRKSEVPDWLAFLITTSVFLFPSLSDNFLRLGPAEPRQILWLLASVFFLWHALNSKKQILIHYIASAFFYFLALTTKETTLLALPALVYLFFAHKLQAKQSGNDKASFARGLIFILVLALGAIGFVVLLPRSGYSSELSFNFARFKENLFAARISFPEHYWFLSLGMLSLVLRSLYQKNLNFIFKRQFLFSIFFLLLALPFLILPLFWPYQLERYLLPGQLFAWLFVGVEFVNFLRFLREKSEDTGVKVLLGYLLVSIGITSVIFLPAFLNPEKMFARLLESKRNWYEQYQYSYALIQYLKDTIAPNTTLVVTHNDYEVIYEIGLYASQMQTKNIEIYSENKDAANAGKALGRPYYLTADARNLFKGLKSPAVLVGRGNAVVQPGVTILFPHDTSLTDAIQLWNVVIK